MPCHNEPPRKIPPKDPNAPRQALPTPLKWTIVVVLGLIAALLQFEHRMHLGAILPWLLLGGCILAYLFVRRGHGARNHAGHSSEACHGNHANHANGDGGDKGK